MRSIHWIVLVLLPFSLASSAAGVSQNPATMAERTLARSDFRWTHRRTANANVYVLRGSAAAPLLNSLADESERAIIDNLEWLGERRTKGRLNLFFVGSRDEQRPFTGTRSAGWSVVAEGTAFLVANDSVKPAIRHEAMHLLSWRLWGSPGGMWLSEGVATASAGRCRDWTIDEIAAALYRTRELATTTTLRRRFRTGGTEGVVHYLSAASLVLYVDETFGRAALKELWQSGLAGVDRVLGVSALELERRWRAHVAHVEAPERWASIARAINRAGCE